MFNVVIIFAVVSVIAKISCCAQELSPLPQSEHLERIQSFDELRAAFIERELHSQLGGDIQLTERELQANERIMFEKYRECDEGFRNPKLFKPSQHFFQVYEEIEKTPLFQMLKTMPKGGILHAHDIALCSTDYLIELTYRQHLWVCMNSETGLFVSSKFSREIPITRNSTICQWILLSTLREMNGADIIDTKLRERLTLYPHEKFNDPNGVWELFRRIFGFLFGMATYQPIWEDLYYRALEEFYADGVQYLEIRSVLPELYDLDGNISNILNTVKVMRNVSHHFKMLHPDFIGSMIIYAPNRNAKDDQFNEYLENALELKKHFPDYFAGFDLVSHEDTGRPLKEFAHRLLEVQDEINFYFHAGETNWNGMQPDENLIDAILLGTKRIGHGYALPKHPEILRLIKEKQIAIEVNPISNQILQHLVDFRNHPASYLLADDYPVVIGSDDPSFWRSTPATHDYYIAFLGIASRSANLGMLKKLAWNSIEYSALDEKRRAKAFELWQKNWFEWIERIANANQTL